MKTMETIPDSGMIAQFLKTLQDGGSPLIIILVCGLIAAFIFLLKFFQFHRDKVNVDELITGLVNVLRRDGMIEAITLCDHSPGPVARLLAVAIHAKQNGDDVRQALEDQALIEVPRLESHLTILATIAYIVPMIGLLGTIVGMMEAFDIMRLTAVVNLTQLSGGVHKALVCMAAGLTVSIPCHIAYNFLLTKVKTCCVEMERASSSLLSFYQHHAREQENEK